MRRFLTASASRRFPMRYRYYATNSNNNNNNNNNATNFNWDFFAKLVDKEKETAPPSKIKYHLVEEVLPKVAKNVDMKKTNLMLNLFPTDTTKLEEDVEDVIDIRSHDYEEIYNENEDTENEETEVDFSDPIAARKALAQDEPSVEIEDDYKQEKYKYDLKKLMKEEQAKREFLYPFATDVEPKDAIEIVKGAASYLKFPTEEQYEDKIVDLIENYADVEEEDDVEDTEDEVSGSEAEFVTDDEQNEEIGTFENPSTPEEFPFGEDGALKTGEEMEDMEDMEDMEETDMEEAATKEEELFGSEDAENKIEELIKDVPQDEYVTDEETGEKLDWNTFTEIQLSKEILNNPDQFSELSYLIKLVANRTSLSRNMKATVEEVQRNLLRVVDIQIEQLSTNLDMVEQFRKDLIAYKAKPYKTNSEDADAEETLAYFKKEYDDDPRNIEFDLLMEQKYPNISPLVIRFMRMAAEDEAKIEAARPEYARYLALKKEKKEKEFVPSENFVDAIMQPMVLVLKNHLLQEIKDRDQKQKEEDDKEIEEQELVPDGGLYKKGSYERLTLEEVSREYANEHTFSVNKPAFEIPINAEQMAAKLKVQTVQEKETNALDDLFKAEYEPHDYEEDLDDFINSKVDLHDIRKTQQQADLNELINIRSKLLEESALDPKYFILPEQLLQEYIRVARKHEGSILSDTLKDLIDKHQRSVTRLAGSSSEYAIDSIENIDDFHNISASPIANLNGKTYLDKSHAELDYNVEAQGERKILRHMYPTQVGYGPLYPYHVNREPDTIRRMIENEHEDRDVKYVKDSQLMDDLELDPVLLARHKPHLVDDPTWSAINHVLSQKYDENRIWNDEKLLYFWKLVGGTEKSIGEGYDPVQAVDRLAQMYPTLTRAHIELVFNRVVGMVRGMKYRKMEEARDKRTGAGKQIKTGRKSNDLAARSTQIIVDKVMDSSTSTIYSMGEYISKPRPKTGAVMDAISLITRRRIKGSQLEQVARLMRIKTPENYKNDWEYLYDVLRPVHGYEKKGEGLGDQTKQFPPRIMGGRTIGVGRRKTSTARVYLTPGSGLFKINGRNYLDYFSNQASIDKLGLPFRLTNSVNQFDVECRVSGGGTTGQVDAIKLALAKALGDFVPGFGTIMKKHNQLFRDTRQVERKKPGKRKSHASFQWVKR